MNKPTLLLAATLMCIPEAGTPFVQVIDKEWQNVQRLTGIQAGRRPTFCFGWEPRIQATPRGSERLLATYDAHNGRVDVSLTPEEMSASGTCVIRHELLHAILGHDESRILAVQNCNPGVIGLF